MRIFINFEFLKFLLIGIVNTFNSIFFSTVYSLVIGVNMSFVLGYISSLGIAYILNNYFVFKDKLSSKKFIKFFASYIPNFIIQNIIVFLGYNIIGIDKIFIYLLAATIGVPITFLFVKLFAFAR